MVRVVAQSLGNMLDIRKAYANVSRPAMLRSWNYIEVETSNSFETLGADALRAAFSGWAQAVYHDLAEHAHDSDSSDEELVPDVPPDTKKDQKDHDHRYGQGEDHCPLLWAETSFEQ